MEEEPFEEDESIKDYSETEDDDEEIEEYSDYNENEDDEVY